MPELKPSSEGNPGLQRWWREHSELDQLVETLLEACEGPRNAAASAALEEFAEALEGHFRVEEDTYFPLIERLDQDLAETLKGARLAHLMVRAQLEELRGCLARGEGAKAREVLKGLLELFRNHEELESRLIAELSTAPAD
jgi:hemerythrin